MWKDEIVDETRRAREAYAASLNYDLEAIYRDLKAKERECGHPVVSLPPKPPLQLNIPKTQNAEVA
jgi:hypothetical protein